MLKRTLLRGATLLGTLLGRIGYKKITRHQVLSVLAKQISYQKLEQLALNNHDRRELFSQAASLLAVTEEEFIKTIAGQLKLPVVKEVKLLDPEIGRQYDFSQLEAGALIPVLSDGILNGYAVADPSLASDFLPDLGGQQLFLASWASIKAALAASKSNFQKWEAGQIELLQSHVNEQTQRVLLNILSQAEKHKSQAIVIRALDDEISYEFKVKDGRRGCGQIHRGLKFAVIERLNQLVQVKETAIADDQQTFTISVSVLSPSDAYQIDILARNELPQTKAITFDVKTPAVSNNVTKLTNVTQPDQEQGLVKLLIVEDNPAFSKVLQCFLSKQGFDVNFALSGKQALEKLSDGLKPDVIICDVHMPEMNGHELVRQLRSAPLTCDIPIIMLTSDHDTETELQFIDYGVDAFISKSSDPRLLVGYAKRLAHKATGRVAA